MLVLLYNVREVIELSAMDMEVYADFWKVTFKVGLIKHFVSSSVLSTLFSLRSVVCGMWGSIPSHTSTSAAMIMGTFSARLNPAKFSQLHGAHVRASATFAVCRFLSTWL